MFVCGICASFGAFFLHAFATDDTKTYLIGANYESQASDYSISSDEIYDASPFDATTSARMAGKSIMPSADEESDFVFDKTYNTNSTEISDSQSVFVYLLFNQTSSHTLRITASDGVSNEISWTLSRQAIEMQIVHTTSVSNMRYGWMLVELPSTQNLTINTLRFEYYSDEIDQTATYARVLIYAPYIAQKVSNAIAFGSKQAYYNYAVNFGTYRYVNDKFKLTNITDLIDYCYLGEIDYLSYPISSYQFILKIINVDEDKTQSHTLVAGTDDFEYQFDKASNYEMSITLFKDSVAITGTTKSFYVNEFSGIYINFGLSVMKKGKTYEYDVVVSDEFLNHGDVSVVSASDGVASVRMDANKLYVTANKKGSTKITISVLAERAGQEAKIYSADYVAYVTEEATGVNWWLMGGTAIFLIVASVVVYTIMVRRRLIKGRYPKY